MKKILFFIGVFCLFTQFNYSAIIYVTETGAGAMNGTSWANAYPGNQLQNAINSALAGDQVWVAGGTYFTTTGTDRTLAFSMKNDVVIYGSFTGTETTLTQRDFPCGPTSILSGGIGTAINTDNSYQVVRNSMLSDTTAQLNGFVITGGYDERSPTLTNGLGGGILNIGSNGNHCLLTLRNCVITNNQSEFGAGIFNDAYNGGQVYVVIENCIITNNYATGGGGGIDNFALSNGNAFCSITNTLIANNNADDAAGAIYCWGGLNGSALVYMVNSTVTNNNVTAGVGGAFVTDRSNNGGGSGGSSGDANIILRSSILWGNTAASGPQFYNYESGFVEVTNSVIDTVGQSGSNSLNTGSFGNMIADPLFLNPTTPRGNDNCWMTNDDGYQLSALSPCLDFSQDLFNGNDLAFNPRWVGISTDLGAYELVTNNTSIQNADELYLKVYPNPTSENLVIESSKDATFYIFSSIGQIIMSGTLKEGNTNLNLSDLSSGVYYITLQGVNVSRKIVVN